MSVRVPEHAQDANAGTDHVAWLAEQVVELDGVWSEALDTRPATLDAAVRGARILGLGQAVGGSRESVALVRRLLERLVDVHGARVIAVAASESATTLLDDHVRGASGDVGELLENLGAWPWRTKEVTELVTWVREHNGAVPASDHVRLVGLEPVRAATAVRVVGQYVRRTAPEQLERRAALLGEILADRVSERLAGAVRAAASEIVDLLAEPPSIDSAGVAEHDEACQHAEFLVRAAELAGASAESVAAVRSRLLAERVATVLGGDGGRGPVVVWAHADDIGVRTTGAPSLGSLLRQHLGDDYYALTVTCGTGIVTARRSRFLRGSSRDPSRVRLPGASATAVETDLGEFEDDVFVDLRALPNQLARAWAARRPTRRSVGEFVSPRRATTPWLPGTASDGLIQLQRTRPARPA